jgi:drug/metabolite transporter (DMT)-like permease
MSVRNLANYKSLEAVNTRSNNVEVTNPETPINETTPETPINETTESELDDLSNNKGQISILFILYLFTNLLNNIGVQQMGYYFPAYSAFLLYGTTIIYTTLFFLTSLYTGDRWIFNRREWWIIFLLGVFTSLNGIFAQIAIPYVSPEITAIVTQISAPLTWISYYYMKKHNVYLIQLIAYLSITFGFLFGTLYSYYHGSGSSDTYKNGVWILITFMSALPTAFETIYQSEAFKRKMPIFSTLTLYNLFSLIWYSLWILMTMVDPFGTCFDGQPDISECTSKLRVCKFSEIDNHQANSIKCFFGDYSGGCCVNTGIPWIWCFTIGYYTSFCIGAYILKRFSPNVIANLNAMTFPLVSIFFWLPKTLTGYSHSTFEWWILIAICFISIGNIMYDNATEIPILMKMIIRNE